MRAQKTLPRWKEWLFRVVAVCVAIVATLALAEAGLRLWIPGSDVKAFGYRSDGIRYKVMLPDLRGKVYGIAFETNSSGFRDVRPYTTARRPGVRRIVVLGDSFTVAAGVPLGELAPRRLEGLIRQAYPGAGVEVYNLAVGGYQIPHYTATLKEVGLGYRPDLVLVFMFPDNDFEARSYGLDRRHAERYARDGEQTRIPRERQRSWYQGLYIHKGFGPPMKAAIRATGVLRLLPVKTTYETQLSELRPGQRDFDLSVLSLRQLAAMAREAGVPVEVFLFPATWGPTFDAQRPLDGIAAKAVASAGLHVHSLLPAFAATGKRPFHFRINFIDGHASAEYYGVAAPAIFDALESAGVLERLMRGPLEASHRASASP